MHLKSKCIEAFGRPTVCGVTGGQLPGVGYFFRLALLMTAKHKAP